MATFRSSDSLLAWNVEGRHNGTRAEAVVTEMVSDSQIALHALHQALVAARNLGVETPGAPGVLDIVDTLECVPLWIADPERDRTKDLVALFDGLAAEHAGCGLAAATAARLRRA